jgi:acetyl esterase/lipase
MASNEVRVRDLSQRVAASPVASLQEKVHALLRRRLGRIFAWFCAVPAGVALLLGGCSPLSVLNDLLVPSDGWVAHRDIAYGSDARHRLDVYAPANLAGPAPVVVFFYGGSWRGGKRDHYAFIGEALTSRGCVVVVPDYRVYPDARFPDFIEDAAQAIAWVQDNIDDFGGDHRTVFVMGHSAGAHIAAMLVTDRRYLDAAGVDRRTIRGFVGLSGPYAFDPSRFDVTRPIFATAADVATTQPITFVDGEEPPMLLLHGADDSTVYPINSVTLGDRVRTAGGSATVIEYPDIGHIRLVLDLAAPFRRDGGVLDDIDQFLTSVEREAAPARSGEAGESRQRLAQPAQDHADGNR